MENSLKESIEKHVLQNAFKFGKADKNAVIKKIIAEFPDLKNKIKDISKDIEKKIKEISKLKNKDIEKRLKEVAPELLEKKEIPKKELPDIPGAKLRLVTTRLPPEPSKYLHIGHALSFLINYLYAKKYQGKCILRFEDTNPLTSTQEYVDSMLDDILNYLEIKPDEIFYASDDINLYYKVAEQLIKEGKAFVCFCPQEKIKEFRMKGVECKCRSNPKDTNLESWNEMLKGTYDSGTSTLRLKIDMKSQNMAMRDPVIFRITKANHYRHKNKYCLWPLYDFENVIEDEKHRVTHILRSSEFGNVRIELQNYIKDLFNYKKQVIIQYGRFNVIGAITKGREIRELIQEKKVLGWDDPRLVTLKALKRRGIQKETLYDLALEVGLSKTETNIDWKLIAALNRRVLDQKALRYFFIKDPIKIKIQGASKQDLELDLHPDNYKGGRKFKTNDEFYIEREDYQKMKIKNEELVRLMNCLNFKKEKKEKNKFIFDSKDVEKFREKGKLIIHWLPVSKDNLKVNILMPDSKFIEGIAESNLKKIKVNDVIQFERFGFCRLDKKENEDYFFVYTHL